MYKKLIFIAFIFIACIDFDIDAPYDDINSIYLENAVTYYTISGVKIEIENERGYIRSSRVTDIVCYDFSDIHQIDTISAYRSVYTKPDFAIANGYAYVASDGLGLEIVDFNQIIPQLTGFLPISGSIYSIVLSGSHAFITGNWRLHVIDVGTITSPVHIAEYTFDRHIRNAQVEAGTLYVLLSSGKMQIIDITELTNPQLIAEHNLSDTLENADYFVKHDDYLYVTKGFGIDAYEIQEAGNLKYLNTLSFSHSITFLETFESYGICLYISDTYLDRLYLLNLAYPSRPCIGEILDMFGDAEYAVISNQYIYLLGYILQIIEIKDIE